MIIQEELRSQMPVRNEIGTTWRQIEHRSREEKRATLMLMAPLNKIGRLRNSTVFYFEYLGLAFSFGFLLSYI